MIAFAAYKNHLNEQRYAVRGMGIEMDEFNAWARNKIVATDMEWPWLSFKFLEQADEAQFWLKYNVPGTYFDTENN